MKEHIQKSLVFDQIAYLDKLIEEALDGEARDNTRELVMLAQASGAAQRSDD